MMLPGPSVSISPVTLHESDSGRSGHVQFVPRIEQHRRQIGEMFLAGIRAVLLPSLHARLRHGQPG